MSIAKPLTASFLLVIALTACGAEDPPRSGPPSATPAAVPATPGVAAVPSGPPGDATASVPPGDAGCGESIDDTARPSDGYRIVAANVAIPASEQLLEVSAQSSVDGPTRMFAKWGLLIRNGRKATLSLAPDWAGRARLGWGGTTPSTEITVTACPSGDGGWTVFAGGTWVSEADCVPIRIDTGQEQVTVEMSVGVPCGRPGG